MARQAIERESVDMTSDVNEARDARPAARAMFDAPWSRPSGEVLSAVDSRANGLTVEEVERRLQRFGPNRLAPPKPKSWWRRALAQFDDILIYILLVAAAAKAVIGDWVDFSVILGVAVIIAIIGLVQE